MSSENEIVFGKSVVFSQVSMCFDAYRIFATTDFFYDNSILVIEEKVSKNECNSVAGGNDGVGGVGDIMRWYSVRVVGSLMLQETG